MARKLSIFMLFLVTMMLLLVENHAEIKVATTEAPAPQPNRNTTNFPMAVFNLKNVVHVAGRDAQRRNTRNRACSSVKSAVPNVCVCLLGLTATSRSALAIIIGRPKEEDPSAPETQTLTCFLAFFAFVFCFLRKERQISRTSLANIANLLKGRVNYEIVFESFNSLVLELYLFY